MVLLVAVAALGLGGDVARADRTASPTPLDMQLLEADCAIRARVISIKPLATVGDLELNRVGLEVIEQMWCRWAWATEGASFDAIGRRSEDEGSLRIPHRGVLTQEGEYILLLRGGEVRGSPVAATGLIRVGDAGNAECGGGHIYGLTPAGVRCSWDGVEVSAPLTGAELATELTAAHGNAELRRTDVAARVDGLSFDGPGVPR